MAKDADAERVLFPARMLFQSDIALNGAIRELASKSKPRVISLDVGDDVVAVLRHEYFDAAQAMWSSIQRANSYATAPPEVKELVTPYQILPPSIDVKHPVEQFVLPSGPRWRLSPSRTTAGPHDTIESIAAKYLGASGAFVGVATAALKAANQNMNLDGSLAGRTLTIPERSYPTIIRRTDPNIMLLSSSGISNDGRTDVLHLTRPVSSAHNTCGAGAQDWPVNWQRVFDVIKANDDLRLQLQHDPIVVAIIDTGVAQTEDGQHRILFWRGGDGNGIGFDETANTGASHPQTPWENFQDQILQDHGTHVAALVHGGAIAAGDRAKLQRFSKLMILKVVLDDKNGGTIEPDAMIGAIRDALEIGRATVINISVAPSNSRAKWNELSQHNGSLFVVAAGNGHPEPHNPQWYDLDDESLDPADLGGAETPNVISVAAHDNKGDLADFSNRGKRSVTLAAPGCAIDSFLSDPAGSGKLTGTSQAAPIVTAAAAILSYYGLSARETKERIIASVEWIQNLDQDTFAGGVFSFEKTIDVFADLLLKKPLRSGGSVEHGLITTSEVNSGRQYVLSFKKESESTTTQIPLTQTLKLTVIGKRNDGQPRIRIVYTTAGATKTIRIENVRLMTKLRFAIPGSPPDPVDLNQDLDIVFGSKVTLRFPDARLRPSIPLAAVPVSRSRYVAENGDSGSVTNRRRSVCELPCLNIRNRCARPLDLLPGQC